jgi:hypothetical protein
MSSATEIARETSLRCPGDRRGLPGKTGAVAGLDGRLRAARRLRAIAADMEAQLPAPLTAAMRAMVKRASELALAAEMARGQLVSGQAVSIAEVVKLENLAARAARDLHNRAAARGPTSGPTLGDLLRQDRADQLAAAAGADDGAAK